MAVMQMVVKRCGCAIAHSLIAFTRLMAAASVGQMSLALWALLKTFLVALLGGVATLFLNWLIS